jgi:serine/threonine-protein kinase
MFNPGDAIGPYTLVRKLGEGCFGLVWLAQNNSHPAQGLFALKTLKHPDANAILQEVFNWAKADGHPNILPILDAGVYPTPHGDTPVIASSYMQEGSLRTWIEQHQPITTDSAIEISCGILDGLEHLHRRRIVHRDLKPENVLVYQGTPLLTDFGIARFQRSESDIQTVTVAGTVPYMAPEAFRGVRSPQTDVWAAAVICYEMLAGRRPFPPDVDLITSPAPAPPLPLSTPRPLRKALEFALRKDPALRCYKSAAELRATLLGAADTGLTHLPPPADDDEATTLRAEPQKSQARERAEVPPPPAPAGEPQKTLELSADKIESRNAIFTNRKTKKSEPGVNSRDDTRTKVTVGNIKAEEDFRLTNEEEV